MADDARRQHIQYALQDQDEHSDNAAHEISPISSPLISAQTSIVDRGPLVYAPAIEDGHGDRDVDTGQFAAPASSNDSLEKAKPSSPSGKDFAAISKSSRHHWWSHSKSKWQESRGSHANRGSVRRLVSCMRALGDDSWLLEILGMVVSLAAMGAIVGLLFQWDNKPLKSWPYAITINSMVSVLNTVAKSTMLLVATQAVSQLKWLWFYQPDRQPLSHIQIFDDASRGPLGAVTFLIKIIRPNLASLGALIVIISIAMDPFVQQILSTDERSVAGALINIPQALSYAGRNTTYYKVNGEVDDNDIGVYIAHYEDRAVY